MKMRDILRVARGLAEVEVEPPEGIWSKVKEQLEKRMNDPWHKFVDLTGRQYFDWTVLKRVENRDGAAVYLCQCVCGGQYKVKGSMLRYGKSKRCMCCRSRKRPFEALYNKFKLSARHAVEISYEEFVEFAKETRCHYCWFPITFAAHAIAENGQAYHMDRKDNAAAYYKDNIVVCCKRCNRGRSNHFTYEEWWAMTSIFRSGETCAACDYTKRSA
jgi:hypothetical protein